MFQRLLSASVLFLVMSYAAVQAESYQCTFKPRSVERNLFPTTLRIDWPHFLKPAHITDTIIQANGLKDVLAHDPIEAGKRITFSWKLHQIHLPQFGYLYNVERSKANIRYKLTLYTASGKATLNAMQFSTIYFSDRIIRVIGRCKEIK